MKQHFYFLLLGTAIFIFSGCASLSSVETKYYSLKSQKNITINPTSSNLSIGLGPLEFPQLLDRPHLVSRDKNHAILRADYVQWGGSLEREFLQVLADHLEANLGTSQISIYPWNNRRRPDYQVRMNVSRFDGELGGDVTLSARWQVLSQNGKELVKSKNSQIVVPTVDTGYASYVASMAKCVEQLAAEISDVEELYNNPND